VLASQDVPPVAVIPCARLVFSGCAERDVSSRAGKADFAGYRPSGQSNSEFTDRSQNDGDNGSRIGVARRLLGVQDEILPA
jgi:hypothetical protein